jgi:hypothetical protein
MYMCLFCALLCLGRGLLTSWSLAQGVLPIVNRSGKWKAARAHKGCRAIQEKEENIVWRNYAMQELLHQNTLPRLRNSRRSGVLSVPSRADPNRAMTNRLASPRLVRCQATSINTCITQEWGRVTWPRQKWRNNWSVFPHIRSSVYRRDWS